MDQRLLIMPQTVCLIQQTANSPECPYPPIVCYIASEFHIAHQVMCKADISKQTLKVRASLFEKPDVWKNQSQQSFSVAFDDLLLHINCTQGHEPPGSATVYKNDQYN